MATNTRLNHFWKVNFDDSLNIRDKSFCIKDTITRKRSISMYLVCVCAAIPTHFNLLTSISWERKFNKSHQMNGGPRLLDCPSKNIRWHGPLLATIAARSLAAFLCVYVAVVYLYTASLSVVLSLFFISFYANIYKSEYWQQKYITRIHIVFVEPCTVLWGHSGRRRRSESGLNCLVGA